MFFGFLIIVNADHKHIPLILFQGCNILFVFNLIHSTFHALISLQFDHQCRLLWPPLRQKYHIGKALSRRKLTNKRIISGSCVISYLNDTCQRNLIIVDQITESLPGIEFSRCIGVIYVRSLSYINKIDILILTIS